MRIHAEVGREAVELAAQRIQGRHHDPELRSEGFGRKRPLKHRSADWEDLGSPPVATGQDNRESLEHLGLVGPCDPEELPKGSWVVAGGRYE